MQMKLRTLPAFFLAVFCLAGCATSGAANPEDPYEGFNRRMFAFNDGLDRAVLEPAARGYRTVTNEPVREGVRNFIGNLGEPVTFANEVLQGKLAAAGGTAGRFAINTTIGIVGILDVAQSFGIEDSDADFGQTLGVWGVDAGPYLVLPLLGSSSPRDLTGFGVDRLLDPLTFAQFDGDDALRITRGIGGGLSGREAAIETVDSVRTQVDPYTAVRRFYVRNRAAAAGNPLPPQEGAEEVPESELDF